MTGIDLKIRLAKPGEAAECAVLFSMDGQDWETVEQRRERCQREFKEVASGRRIVLFAYLDDVLVGSAQLALHFPHLGDGLVQSVVVHSQYRRLGIARSLMEAIEQRARDFLFLRILLDVHPQNTPALNLYESLNYIDAPDETPCFSECTRKQKFL
jgi:ribosomal protein S18 acetylase RimI-like enzyme